MRVVRCGDFESQLFILFERIEFETCANKAFMELKIGGSWKFVVVETYRGS